MAEIEGDYRPTGLTLDVGKISRWADEGFASRTTMDRWQREIFEAQNQCTRVMFSTPRQSGRNYWRDAYEIALGRNREPVFTSQDLQAARDMLRAQSANMEDCHFWSTCPRCRQSHSCRTANINWVQGVGAVCNNCANEVSSDDEN